MSKHFSNSNDLLQAQPTSYEIKKLLLINNK